ncbi:MAG: EF-P beta-lysylation protein EpmB [Pontibacterium sp.]
MSAAQPQHTSPELALTPVDDAAQARHRWQTLLSQAISSPQALLEQLQLPLSLLEGAQAAHQDFALKVPAPYLSRIKVGDVNDPLLKQVLPLGKELTPVAGFNQDPLEEKHANPLQGLVHKYHGRILLILSGACAINCRYCFRRHFPYQENQLGKAQWQAILDYIRADESITEVIFSGGDPLATADKRLAGFIKDLSNIAHLKRLRIHTRLPVVIPQRVTDELLTMLKGTDLATTMVLHINHAQEIDGSVKAVVSQLKEAKVTVLNQAVLLKGINDTLDAQINLSGQLFDAGILPYYLFTLDPVAGASHFDVDDSDAIELHQALQTRLPGYLVPRLAREIPGRGSKTLLPDALS